MRKTELPQKAHTISQSTDEISLTRVGIKQAGAPLKKAHYYTATVLQANVHYMLKTCFVQVTEVASRNMSFEKIKISSYIGSAVVTDLFN